MARPQKWGLDYFPFDVDFFDDAKLCAIRKEFNNCGELAAIKLLCAVYHNGYFMEWNEGMRIKLYSELQDVTLEEVDRIVEGLVSWGFFDQKMYRSFHVLTSHGIQKRYFAITKRRQKDPSKYLYLLPNVLTRKPGNAPQPVEGELMYAEIPLLSAESTRKKSKEKDKPSRSEAVSPLSSSPTPPPAGMSCERQNPVSGGFSEGAESVVAGAEGTSGVSEAPADIDTDFETFEVPMTADEALVLLKQDREWLLQMQRKHGIEAKLIVRWLDSFVCDCFCRAKMKHENIADVKQHFTDWLSKQGKPKEKSLKKNQKKPAGGSQNEPMNYFTVWTRCQAELCCAVSAQESAKAYDKIRFESFDPESRVLLLQIPDEQVYQYLEAPNLTLFRSLLRKYFGSLKLKYRVQSLAKV